MVKKDDLSKYLKKYNFETVFNILENSKFSYTIDSIVAKFPKCNSILLYSFLMYSISKKETVQKHIAVCECLRYIDPRIFESNAIIRWHVLRALEIKENDLKVATWAIEVFSSDPSSPFSPEEMTRFLEISHISN